MLVSIILVFVSSASTEGTGCLFASCRFFKSSPSLRNSRSDFHRIMGSSDAAQNTPPVIIRHHAKYISVFGVDE